jgi:hypothetical protein
MRIGLDLDNTIINYQPAFLAQAKKIQLIPDDFDGAKSAIKQYIVKHHDEKAWQKLQGVVYGPGINEAVIYPGVKDFLDQCHQNGHRVTIVSHKTQYGHFDETRTDLRKAALQFLSDNAILKTQYIGLSDQDIHFATTRDEKIAKITEFKFDYFVDDLEEVLEDAKFPSSIHKVHFVPEMTPSIKMPCLTTCQDWKQIARIVGVA